MPVGHKYMLHLARSPNFGFELGAPGALFGFAADQAHAVCEPCGDLSNLSVAKFVRNRGTALSLQGDVSKM